LIFGGAAALMWAAYFSLLERRGDLVWDEALWGGVVAYGFIAAGAVTAGTRWLTGARPGLRSAEMTPPHATQSAGGQG
jgi:hypothetical protein